MKSFFRLTIFFLFILFIFFLTCEKKSYQLYGSGVFEVREVTVSAQTSGLITNLPVKEGQQIQKGDLIAQLDVEKQIIQKKQFEAGLEEVILNISAAKELIEQAKIQYENLKRNYERFTNLLEQESASQQTFDEIETKLKIAEKNLKSAQIKYEAALAKKKQILIQLELVERQIKDGTIISPLNGVVLRKLREVGEILMIGAGLVEIADLSEMEIQIYITEKELGLVTLGEELSIKIDSFPNEIFQGTVSWISPKAEFTPKNVQTKEARANLVYAVKLNVPNKQGTFKIGMPADVYKE